MSKPAKRQEKQSSTPPSNRGASQLIRAMDAEITHLRRQAHHHADQLQKTNEDLEQTQKFRQQAVELFEGSTLSDDRDAEYGEGLGRLERRWASRQSNLGRLMIPNPSKNSPSPPYRGMGAMRAAVAFLRAKGSPEKNSLLARALVEGGYQTTSKPFHRTLFNTLKNDSKRKRSEIVKHEDGWALKEWNYEGKATTKKSK